MKAAKNNPVFSAAPGAPTAEVSGNEIARRLNLAPSTMRLTLPRLAVAGLSWPLPAELCDAALEARL